MPNQIVVQGNEALRDANTAGNPLINAVFPVCLVDIEGLSVVSKILGVSVVDGGFVLESPEIEVAGVGASAVIAMYGESGELRGFVHGVSVLSNAVTTANLVAAQSSVNEGDTAYFAINLNQAVVDDVAFNYTINGVSSADYETLQNPITLVGGETSAIIAIPIADDVLTEGSETISITISTNSNALTISNATASTTIIDTSVTAPTVDSPVITLAANDNIVTVNWPAVTDAQRYDVFYTNASGQTTVISLASSAVSYITSALSSGQYDFQVAAYDVNDNASFSDAVSISVAEPQFDDPDMVLALDPAVSMSVSGSNVTAINDARDNVSVANTVNNLTAGSINGRAAMRFSGVDSFLSIPSIAPLFYESTPVVIAAVMQHTNESVTANMMYFMATIGGNGNFGAPMFSLFARSTGLDARLNDSNDTISLSAIADAYLPDPQNDPFVLQVISRNDRLIIISDGIEQYNEVITQRTATALDAFRIGLSANATSPLDGTIGRLEVWSKDMTAQELADQRTRLASSSGL